MDTLELLSYVWPVIKFYLLTGMSYTFLIATILILTEDRMNVVEILLSILLWPIFMYHFLKGLLFRVR